MLDACKTQLFDSERFPLDRITSKLEQQLMQGDLTATVLEFLA